MILILKFLFKFNLGFNIANKIKIITKWKKNLTQITLFNGINVPRYFAVESWQTKIKNPDIDKIITLVIDLFFNKFIVLIKFYTELRLSKIFFEHCSVLLEPWRSFVRLSLSLRVNSIDFTILSEASFSPK